MKLLWAVIMLFSVAAVAEPVDINKADADTIAKSLKGIGPKKAEAIIQYRQQNGAFKSLQDVEKVPGIGPKTIQSNEKDILIGDAPVAGPAVDQKPPVKVEPTAADKKSK